jgi:hypothetical protein
MPMSPASEEAEVNTKPVTAVSPAKGQAGRRSKDFRKPQYIDFESPLLVKLFEHAPGDLAEYSVVFEECLPAASSAVRWHDQSYLTECVLQLTRRA